MLEITGYKCPTCQMDNPKEAKHCMNCGTSLIDTINEAQPIKSQAKHKKPGCGCINLILLVIILLIALISYIHSYSTTTTQTRQRQVATPINCKKIISDFQKAGMIFTNDTGYNEPVIKGAMPGDPNIDAEIAGDLNYPDFLDINIVGLNQQHMLFVTHFANTALPGFNILDLIDKTKKNSSNETSTSYNGYTIKMKLPPYTNMLDLEITRNK